MILAPQSLPHVLIWGGKGGRLTDTATYGTGITGYNVEFKDSIVINGRVAFVHCALIPDGTLFVYLDTQWDFGSGPAIDTPAVVIASLPHDMICHLTNARRIPWACRALGDKMYRVMLAQNGVSAARRGWQWLGVRVYSELVARWKDKL
jgi:hypothetical protein